MINRIEQSKLVPIVVFNNLKEVKPTLSALQEGGVSIAEICYRTECAPEALKIALSEFPNMLIGAGTIINKKQCLDAIEKGAQFIVSPGLSEDVLSVCKERGILYLPGVATPTEIMKALDLGLNHLKLFPAGVLGGLKAIKALSSAFPQVKFLPTGGVDNTNLKDFISHKAVFAVGGSWLLKGNIKETCAEACKIVKGE